MGLGSPVLAHEDVDLTSYEEAGPLAGDDDVDLTSYGAEDVDLTSYEEAGPLAGDDDVDLTSYGAEDVDLTSYEDVDLDSTDGAGALAGAFAATPEIMATKMRVRTIT
ncbi:hypothetical protein Pyn_16437 [Prunus yedoensis var. nudiflora]|uniref:Uncharacterized protein n=1 Tax=Prunus yedoensis var. nudiflora TaxID=2094558 RepID=A0A314Y9G3_PRUYE|nr:hypothetical protein Pyn_16437 [Prunus yedoensis var. nudiflora]